MGIFFGLGSSLWFIASGLNLGRGDYKLAYFCLGQAVLFSLWEIAHELRKKAGKA